MLTLIEKATHLFVQYINYIFNIILALLSKMHIYLHIREGEEKNSPERKLTKANHSGIMGNFCPDIFLHFTHLLQQPLLLSRLECRHILHPAWGCTGWSSTAGLWTLEQYLRFSIKNARQSKPWSTHNHTFIHTIDRKSVV